MLICKKRRLYLKWKTIIRFVFNSITKGGRYLKKIRFRELKELLKYFQEKNVMLKITGLIRIDVNIKKAHIEIKKDKFIIMINQEMNITIDINWVANFYVNNNNTIIKLEFDNLGKVVLAIK